MEYVPKPIATGRVSLTADVQRLVEVLSRNAHEVWSERRIAEGWTLGPERDDSRRQTPSLVPYEELPSSEQDYDRLLVLQTIKAMIALGYRIEKA